MVYDTDFPFSKERDMNYNNGNVGVYMARVSFLCSRLHAPKIGQEGEMGLSDISVKILHCSW
jgi:hypothetical protein